MASGGGRRDGPRHRDTGRRPQRERGRGGGGRGLAARSHLRQGKWAGCRQRTLGRGGRRRGRVDGRLDRERPQRGMRGNVGQTERTNQSHVERGAKAQSRLQADRGLYRKRPDDTARADGLVCQIERAGHRHRPHGRSVCRRRRRNRRLGIDRNRSGAGDPGRQIEGISRRQRPHGRRIGRRRQTGRRLGHGHEDRSRGDGIRQVERISRRNIAHRARHRSLGQGQRWRRHHRARSRRRPHLSRQACWWQRGRATTPATAALLDAAKTLVAVT